MSAEVDEAVVDSSGRILGWAYDAVALLDQCKRELAGLEFRTAREGVALGQAVLDAVNHLREVVLAAHVYRGRHGHAPAERTRSE